MIKKTMLILAAAFTVAALLTINLSAQLPTPPRTVEAAPASVQLEQPPPQASSSGSGDFWVAVVAVFALVANTGVIAWYVWWFQKRFFVALRDVLTSMDNSLRVIERSSAEAAKSGFAILREMGVKDPERLLRPLLLVMLSIIMALPSNAASAPFACVNPKTASAGYLGYPIAPAGVESELRCEGKRGKVLVTDERRKVIDSVGTSASLRIKPTPENVGRANIWIDGKFVSMLAIAEPTEAGLANVWLDMVRQMISQSIDGMPGQIAALKKVFEGMKCMGVPETTCLADFQAQSWGSKPGSSWQAGSDLMSDIKHVVFDSVTTYTANQASSVPEKRIREIAKEEANRAIGNVTNGYIMAREPDDAKKKP